MPSDSDSNLSSITEWLVLGARLLKFLRMHGLVRAVRARACKTLFTQFHLGAVHRIRELAIYMDDLAPDHCSPHVVGIARDTMTAFRDLLSDLLETPDGELHACLKVIEKGENGMDRVVTLGRSAPQDYRYDDNKIDGEHYVNANSDWSALMGRDDGKTRWQRPFSCFSCNDLSIHVDKYQCSRTSWSNLYLSTIAFPLRYISDPGKNVYSTFGFIVFYSKRRNVFPGFPDIFDYVDQWDTYHGALKQLAAFQMVAALADTLALALRPSYDHNRRRNELKLEDLNAKETVPEQYAGARH